MPGGLDNIAPKTNASLAMDICGSGGGLLSEFPIGTAPFPANFVTRDATQAALSAAVILVQSDKKGGSLHASRACVRLGRTLVVVAPSNGDVEVGEPKIAANLVLISGTPGEATRSMEFPQNAKEYIYPLSSKEQYQEVIQLIKTAWEGFAPKRVGMDSQPMRR